MREGEPTGATLSLGRENPRAPRHGRRKDKPPPRLTPSVFFFYSFIPHYMSARALQRVQHKLNEMFVSQVKIKNISIQFFTCIIP